MNSLVRFPKLDIRKSGGDESKRECNAEGKERLDLVVEPLLEASYLTGASSTAWYLLPDPEASPVIRTMSSEGQGPAPQLASFGKLTSDEIQFKGSIDFDVLAVSPYAVKSTGA